MQPVLESHHQKTYLEYSPRFTADTCVLAFLWLGGFRATGEAGILAMPGVEELPRAKVAEGDIVGTGSREESSGGTGSRWQAGTEFTCG